MKQELTTAVDRGDSDNAIIQFFVQTYGTLVLAAPTNSGFDRIAWIMPYIALFGGIAMVVVIVWFWRKRPAPAVTVAAHAADLDHLREQIRKETEL